MRLFKEYFTGAYAFDIFYDHSMIQTISWMMIEDYYRFFLEIARVSLTYYPHTIESCKINEDKEIIVFVVEIAFEPFYILDEIEYFAWFIRYEVADLFFLFLQ